MLIKEDLYIDGLRYVLKYEHSDFAFYLNRPPQARIKINYKKHPELALFRDDPIYEDLKVKLPALKVFHVMSQRIESLIYKHKIQYWSFSATSVKKANVYEKLLMHWIDRNTLDFKYDRYANDFHVYILKNFND